MKIPFLQLHIVRAATLENIKAKARAEQRTLSNRIVAKLLYENFRFARALNATRKKGR